MCHGNIFEWKDFKFFTPITCFPEHFHYFLTKDSLLVTWCIINVLYFSLFLVSWNCFYFSTYFNCKFHDARVECETKVLLKTILEMKLFHFNCDHISKHLGVHKHQAYSLFYSQHCLRIYEKFLWTINSSTRYRHFKILLSRQFICEPLSKIWIKFSLF